MNLTLNKFSELSISSKKLFQNWVLMFKFPGARKQVQGQVLFKNKNKVKVRVVVKVFVSEKVFCYDWW